MFLQQIKGRTLLYIWYYKSHVRNLGINANLRKSQEIPENHSKAIRYFAKTARCATLFSLSASRHKEWWVVVDCLAIDCLAVGQRAVGWPVGDWCVGDWCVGDWCVGDWCVGDWCVRDWCVHNNLMFTHIGRSLYNARERIHINYDGTTFYCISSYTDLLQNTHFK